jgi:DNA-directed RNA polymerase subunit F
MIIVITDNGNKYFPENAVESVIHNREKGEAYVYLPNKDNASYKFKDVQQVVYIGNNSDVTIKEDSNVVADLKKLLKEEESRYDDLLKNSTMMRTYALKLMKCDPELYDKINEEVHQEFKDYLNNKRNEQANKSKPGD